MERRIGLLLLLLVWAAVVGSGWVAAQEQTLTLTGSAGATGSSNAFRPAGGVDLGYARTGVGAAGGTASVNVGIGYVSAGYAVPTPVGLLIARGAAAPLSSEYTVVEGGDERTLDMEAPAYRAMVGILVPTPQVTVSLLSSVEARPWSSTDSAFLAPRDTVAWTNEANIGLRPIRKEWSENEHVPEAGWSVSGGYRNTYRPEYAEWGSVSALIGHNDAPQQELTGATSLRLPVGPRTHRALLDLTLNWSRAFNTYERDAPRLGHPAETLGRGISGYAPESVRSERAALAAAALLVPLGDSVLSALRFDWLYLPEQGARQLRGVGAEFRATLKRGSVLTAGAGFALDAPRDVELPVTGVISWTRTVKIGEQNRWRNGE